MLDHEQQLDFTELWQATQPVVAAYVRGIVRDTHVAKDIVQNIAVVLMRKFELWDSSQAFLPWAMGFAKFEILAHRRNSARCRIVFDEHLLDSITELWPSVSANLEMEESEALHECLGRLDANAREMVQLRYFEDLQTQQVADRLRSTAGAVRIALMRIRRQLSSCVNNRLKKQRGEE